MPDIRPPDPPPAHRSSRVVVTGGVGYIGARTCLRLREAGHEVVAVDALLHEQEDVADLVERAGVELRRVDVRDRDGLSSALVGADAVVHLAAIVGDPACAADPDGAREVNVVGARLVADVAAEVGAERLLFASTCSNYGRLDDPLTPVAETAPLRPVSLYAEQKVQIERELLEPDREGPAVTVLRFATIHGLAERMRFDLTVNEFTRDLAAGRRLEVFGEQFWRPYLHVDDAARAVVHVLGTGLDVVGGAVFNVGSTAENYRKQDLVDAIRRTVPTGEVAYVRRDEDPRDYQVDFAKARDVLGFVPRRTVPDGIREIAAAVADGTFADPWHRRHRNTP